jgi:isoleucyl-tRNA synthetase
MEKYDIPNAVKPIMPFIDDASNWYVRRSRKRFWKSSNDRDKDDAYKTLHYVLVQLALVMAPFTPFMSEELFKLLTRGESVHLIDWPKDRKVNEMVITKMEFIRQVITEGLAQRATNAIKVRQPLLSVTIKGGPVYLDNIEDDYVNILKEELNVKEVLFNTNDKNESIVIDTLITDELKQEGLMREIIRYIQQKRKQDNLEVDDRIETELISDSQEVKEVINDKDLSSVIKSETLSTVISIKLESSVEYSDQVNGHGIKAKLKKSS